MITKSCALEFRDGKATLRTPWLSAAARGLILVNDEPLEGGWGRDASGSATCTHSHWKVTIVEASRDSLSVRIENQGSSPAILSAVHVARWSPDAFDNALDASVFRELVHGGSFMAMTAGVKCVGRKIPFLDHVATSSMFTVYQRDDGQALLLGVLPPLGEAFSEFATLHAEPHCEASFGFEVRHRFECEVHPGDSVQTAPLVALAGNSGTKLMNQYGVLWANLQPRQRSRQPMTGWNSWDYYLGTATRATMDEQLAQGRNLFGAALKATVIDDGWQCRWGCWDANHKFAAGLTDFCRHVKEQGGVPGIWTAPLLVNTSEPLFMNRPEWFARGADGAVVTNVYSDGKVGYLDVTNPDVLTHVAAIFKRLGDAGIEYYKVDFCHCVLEATRFADRRVGRNGLLRRAFQTIREAIGEKAYLVGCGAPYESVTGLVDAVRSTGDIHVVWGHVLRNVGSLAARWWMHGRLWNCDPDFLVVRGPDTAHPLFGKARRATPMGPELGWNAGREFNESEARTYALLVHLSGGDVILSDRLDKLNPVGIEMIRRVLVPRATAVPEDLFESEQDYPRIWISRGVQDTLVGLFNWSDKPCRIVFAPERYALRGMPLDFWTGKPVSGWSDVMPRRSSIALRFDHPSQGTVV